MNCKSETTVGNYLKNVGVDLNGRKAKKNWNEKLGYLFLSVTSCRGVCVYFSTGREYEHELKRDNHMK
jgi:hypothetical protein